MSTRELCDWGLACKAVQLNQMAAVLPVDGLVMMWYKLIQIYHLQAPTFQQRQLLGACIP